MLFIYRLKNKTPPDINSLKDHRLFDNQELRKQTLDMCLYTKKFIMFECLLVFLSIASIICLGGHLILLALFMLSLILIFGTAAMLPRANIMKDNVNLNFSQLENQNLLSAELSETLSLLRCKHQFYLPGPLNPTIVKSNSELWLKAEELSERNKKVKEIWTYWKFTPNRIRVMDVEALLYHANKKKNLTK